MAKISQVKKVKKDETFPFERENYIILGVGLLLIVAGYVALSGNTIGGFVTLTLAPLLLVIGYCIVVPFGILYRKKEKKSENQSLSQTAQ